jgi:hypothetical protein
VSTRRILVHFPLGAIERRSVRRKMIFAVERFLMMLLRNVVLFPGETSGKVIDEERIRRCVGWKRSSGSEGFFVVFFARVVR